MKNLILLYCSLMLLLASCNSGNKVASSFGFGKRKYTKGYYSFLHSRKLNTIAAIPAVKPQHDTRTAAVIKVAAKEPVTDVINTETKPLNFIQKSLTFPLALAIKLKASLPWDTSYMNRPPSRSLKHKEHTNENQGLVGFILTVGGIFFTIFSFYIILLNANSTIASNSQGALISLGYIGFILIIVGFVYNVISVLRNNKTHVLGALGLAIDLILLLLLRII